MAQHMDMNINAGLAGPVGDLSGDGLGREGKNTVFRFLTTDEIGEDPVDVIVQENFTLFGAFTVAYHEIWGIITEAEVADDEVGQLRPAEAGVPGGLNENQVPLQAFLIGVFGPHGSFDAGDVVVGGAPGYKLHATDLKRDGRTVVPLEKSTEDEIVAGPGIGHQVRIAAEETGKEGHGGGKLTQVLVELVEEAGGFQVPLTGLGCFYDIQVFTEYLGVGFTAVRKGLAKSSPNKESISSLRGRPSRTREFPEKAGDSRFKLENPVLIDRMFKERCWILISPALREISRQVMRHRIIRIP